MKIRLSLATLGQLDLGKIDAAFQRELAHVVKDCVDRPSDTSARKVELDFVVVPKTSDGVCDTVDVEVSLKSTVPPRRTRPYEMQVHASGALLVNPESPGDVKQMTLDEQAAARGDRELDRDEGVKTTPARAARKPQTRGVDGKGTYEPS